MISRSKGKWIKQLHQKKFRKEQGLFIAEGDKVVSELLSSAYIIRTIIATNDWRQPPGDFEIDWVSESELQSLSALHTAGSVIAIAEQKTEEAAVIEKGCYYLLLDGIRDPGNMGTLIRIADWFGLEAVICSEDCVDFYNPKVVQSAMGSLFRKKVYSCNLTDLIKDHGTVPVYGALLEGKSIYTCSFEPGMLLIGNESQGISDPLRSLIKVPVTIPFFGNKDGGAESLNAAVAAAVICSEIRRRQ